MPAKRIGPRNKCALEGCLREERTMTLCISHYNRKVRYGDVRADIPIRPKIKDHRCSVQDCDNPSEAHSLCTKHGYRMRKYGATDTPPPRRFMRRVTNQGYILLWAPDHPNANVNGNIFEHRLLMSRHLGRPLLASESVHHRNGDRQDNRLENLELWTGSQPAGQRVEDKVEWAIELLRLYEPTALAPFSQSRLMLVDAA